MRRDYLPFGRPNFSAAEEDAVLRVMRSGWIGMGSETLAFEEELATFVGAPYVVTVNSCTSGLFLSLLVAGIGQGDEVICPSFTWCSTANAALYLGAKPVFCDIDPHTLSVSPDTVRARLTNRTRAVMVVHYAGYAVDVDAIRRVLPANVAIVEDAAHALGAKYPNGSPVGSSGNLVCYSFYANKNLSTGEGGAIAVHDPAVAEHLASLRQHALPVDAWKRFTHPKSIILSGQLTELGYKMNYTDLQAALGRVQLRRQAEFFGIRKQVAQIYVSGLRSREAPVLLQRDCDSERHARHLFVVLLRTEGVTKGRDDILLAMRAKNLGASFHYAPLHEMALYRADMQPEPLRCTESVARRIITLPMSASMTESDAEQVVEALCAELN